MSSLIITHWITSFILVAGREDSNRWCTLMGASHICIVAPQARCAGHSLYDFHTPPKLLNDEQHSRSVNLQRECFPGTAPSTVKLTRQSTLINCRSIAYMAWSTCCMLFDGTFFLWSGFVLIAVYPLVIFFRVCLVNIMSTLVLLESRAFL